MKKIVGPIDFSKIRVDHMRSPIGSCGFRTGDWTVYYEGEEYKVYASVPHAMDLDDQAERVRWAFSRQYGDLF
jgi:hypothetical protein